MNIYTLSGNKIKPIEIDDITKKGLIWIRAIKPEHKDLKTLSKISKIPIDELRETVEEEERPRLFKKDYIELIYDIPQFYKNEGLLTMEIYFYISDNLIITIEEKPSKVLNKIEENFSENNNKFMFKSKGGFLHHVIDEINDEYILRIEKSGKSLQSLDQKDLDSLKVTDLYKKSMTFAHFNQAIIANLEVLSQLRKCNHRAFTQKDRENFNELYLDKLQILDTEKIQRELIMNMINMQTILSAEKLNKTMKTLAAGALLVMVPTLITGVYGMNIPLPFQNHPNSFGILISFMVSSFFLILLIFKKWEWI